MVVRYWNNDVLSNLPGVLADLATKVDRRRSEVGGGGGPPPPPPPRGGWRTCGSRRSWKRPNVCATGR
jgi:hypothetical protein